MTFDKLTINSSARFEKIDEDALHDEFIDYDFDENCEEVARQRGCIVVIPAANQLQLDLDTEEAYRHFQRRYNELYGNTGYNMRAEATVSASGLPHRHVTITAKDHVFEPWERFAMQMLLGSDMIRETLNVYRHLAGVENPTRLFEKKP